jgi:hypothetical protein
MAEMDKAWNHYAGTRGANPSHCGSSPNGLAGHTRFFKY